MRQKSFYDSSYCPVFNGHRTMLALIRQAATVAMKQTKKMPSNHMMWFGERVVEWVL